MPLLVFAVFTIMAAFAVLLPTIMFFLENLGAPKAVATQILACYSFAQFVAGPLLGRLSDRVGRKPVMLAALLVAILSYYCLGYHGTSLLAVAVTISCAGLCAGVVAVIFAATADVTAPDRRSANMGFIGAGIGTAFTLGPALGAWLGGADAGQASIRLPATASCLLLVAGLVAVAFWRHDREQAGTEIRARAAVKLQGGVRASLREQPILALLCGMMFLFTLALALMEPVLPYFSRDRYEWGPRDLGYLFAYAGLVVIVVQGGLVGRVARHFGEIYLVRAGIFLMAGGLLLMVYGPGSLWMFAAVTLTGAGSALFNTSVLAIGSHRAGADRRGLVMGMLQSMQALGRSSGPLAAGYLYQVFAGLPMLSGVGLMAVLACLGLMLYQYGMKKEGMQDT